VVVSYHLLSTAYRSASCFATSNSLRSRSPKKSSARIFTLEYFFPFSWFRSCSERQQFSPWRCILVGRHPLQGLADPPTWPFHLSPTSDADASCLLRRSVVLPHFRPRASGTACRGGFTSSSIARAFSLGPARSLRTIKVPCLEGVAKAVVPHRA